MRNLQRSTGIRAATAAAAFGVAFATAACPGPQPVATPPGVPAPPGAVVLTDANITSIFITANQAEIQRGQLALERSRSQAVREFAQRMIEEHGAVVQQTQVVMQRRGIGLDPGTLTPQLQSAGTETAQRLNQHTGADFDRAYIDYEVDNHRWLLQSLDDMLIPATRDRELEALLLTTRPVVVSHLEHAQRIQAQLRQMHRNHQHEYD